MKCKIEPISNVVKQKLYGALSLYRIQGHLKVTFVPSAKILTKFCVGLQKSAPSQHSE
jgi:hypothetical protein